MKTILVVDMPKNCNECVFRDTTEYGHRCCATLPRTKLGEIEGHIPRHVDCPLKPLPQKKDTGILEGTILGQVEQLVFEGWNRCIDEILGETE